MVQKPRVEKVVIQFTAICVRVSVQQSSGAVEMKMPISFSLIKNLEFVSLLLELTYVDTLE